MSAELKSVTVSETLPSAGAVEKPQGTRTARLKTIGGSNHDDWNLTIASRVADCVWHPEEATKEQVRDAQVAAVSGVVGIAPKDEIEAMLAAQMVATHNAVMECHRRAMLPNQTFEGRGQNLKHAASCSRSFVALTEALERHRGSASQQIRVDHVHVHQGGQAIVGTITHPGGQRKSEGSMT